ncbi:unnamed protein product [Musa banksii]
MQLNLLRLLLPLRDPLVLPARMDGDEKVDLRRKLRRRRIRGLANWIEMADSPDRHGCCCDRRKGLGATMRGREGRGWEGLPYKPTSFLSQPSDGIRHARLMARVLI